jgi:uncharacterized protein (TIGR00369 family)
MPQERITAAAITKTIADTFPGDVGVEPIEITDEKAVARLVVQRQHLHAGGFVHGGVWVTLADSVAAFGTFRHLKPGQHHTTIELKMNVLRSATVGDELIAVARPQHIGRSTQVWEVRVAKGDVLAGLFVCTQMVIDPSA